MTSPQAERGTFSEGLLEGLKEALAWKKGRLELEEIIVFPAMPSETRGTAIE